MKPHAGLYKPGQSGNPLGMASPKAQQRRLARSYLEKHLDKAVAVIVDHLKSTEPQDQQWAAKMLLEYVCGKPSQEVEVSGSEEGAPLEFVVNVIRKDIVPSAVKS